MISYLIIHLVLSSILLAVGFVLFGRFCDYDKLSPKGLGRTRLMFFGLPALLFGLSLAEFFYFGNSIKPINSVTIVIGASPMGMLQLCLWCIPAATGFLLFKRDYLKPLDLVETDVAKISSSYRKYLVTAKDPNWARDAESFLQSGVNRAPFFFRKRFSLLYAQIQDLKVTTPSEVTLLQARDLMETGNPHRAVNMLQAWRSSWEETRKALGALEQRSEGIADESALFGSLSKSTVVDSGSFLFKALDFVQVYPEDVQESIWLQAWKSLRQGKIQELYVDLCGSFDDWRVEWEEALQQRMIEILLILVETNSLNRIETYLEHVKSPSLRSEVMQVIADCAHTGSEILDQAIKEIEKDGVVGNRRKAFILKRKGDVAKARDLLASDLEARNWISHSAVTK